MKRYFKYIFLVLAVVTAVIVGIQYFTNSSNDQYVGTLVVKPLPCDTVPATCGDALYFVMDGGEFFLVRDPIPSEDNFNKMVRVVGTTQEIEPKPCLGGEECITKFITITKVTVIK